MSKYCASSNYNNVRVVVRTRPTLKFARSLISLESDNKTVTACYPKRDGLPSCYLGNVQQKWSFKLDKYLHEASQEQVFAECGQDLVCRVLNGFNATIMAYGQTGAGKTYTMMGSSVQFDERGVIPRAVSQLFKEIASRPEHKISIKVSYLEIYNDNIRDLLSHLSTNPSKKTKPSTHTVCEDENGSMYVKGLTIHPVANEEEVLNMLFEGETHRAIDSHSLNLHSSRSHCIFTIYVESRSCTDSKYTLSKLNLVDMAGSERIEKTNAQGSTQVEARHINKSMSFLEQVALALTEKGREFVPYRQSKLTHYLKDSLGGNCCTMIIANIWPEAQHIEETGVIKEQEEEIKMLRMELAMQNAMLGKPSISYEPLSEVEQQDLEQNIRLYITGVIPELEVKSVRQVKEMFHRFKNLVLSAERSLTQSSCSITNTDRHTPTQPSTADTHQSHKKVSIATKRSKRQTNTSVTYSESEPEQAVQDTKVGETDGAGFALGKPSDSKSVPSFVAAVKKVTKRNESLKSSKANAKEDVKVAVDIDGDQTIQVTEESPNLPTKEEEFENFKKGRGKKINEVFLSNKEQYMEKKKLCLELSDIINKLKEDIDKQMKYLNDLKKESEAKKVFPLPSETGAAIMEEEEFQVLKELTKLKTEYRKKYDEFKDEQQCMRILKQYMDRARTKLLVEFEEWYKVCFVGGEQSDEEEEETKKVVTDHERYEKHRSKALKNDPATIAFYNAQIRTRQRFQANSTTRKQARKPGQVMVSVSSRPPGVMTII